MPHKKIEWGTKITDVLSVIIYLIQLMLFIVTMSVGMVYQKTGSLHKTSQILLLIIVILTQMIEFLFFTSSNPCFSNFSICYIARSL